MFLHSSSKYVGSTSPVTFKALFKYHVLVSNLILEQCIVKYFDILNKYRLYTKVENHESSTMVDLGENTETTRLLEV